MINAIAIDDEPLALEIVKQYCSQLPDVDLVKTFENPVAALEYINQHHPDLVFIDIDMPDINGIELVNRSDIKPMIIFTTAFKEFALEGFELEAVDYLLKPFSFERFDKSIRKAQSKMKSSKPSVDPDHIFVNVEYKLCKILFEEILYIESLDDYIKIHLTNDNPVMTIMSLKKISEKLPTAQFIRIHRSYIVSVKQLTQISGRKIKLRNGTQLPLGERYSAAVTKLIRGR